MSFIWIKLNLMWNMQLNELMQFKNMHSYAAVPQKYECFPKLGPLVKPKKEQKRS